MTPHPLTSQRHEYVGQPADQGIPQILAAAWSICTPADIPLVDQLNNDEKSFLVLLAEYIVTSLDSPLSASDPTTVLSDILMTARHRLSLLSKETTLSPNFIVISAVLHLLTNLFGADNMKYKTVDQFLEVYTEFHDRPTVEIEKLLHTANWMHILFQITTAKKNKGMVMIIVPKFIEGNSVQYVTGSGQTQPTKDRVTVYETEGNVKPIKRLHRKTKKQLVEIENQTATTKKQSGAVKRKPTYLKRKTLKSHEDWKPVMSSLQQSHSSTVLSQNQYDQPSPQQHQHVKFNESVEKDEEVLPQLHHVSSDSQPSFSTSDGYGSGYQNYLPLPLSFSMAPPIPVRRSQSSFSQAAAAIASFNQTVVQNSSLSNNSPPNSPSYVCSPRECYLDVEANGTIRKTSSFSPRSSSVTNTSSIIFGSSGLVNPTTGGSDQLQMLREVSEDSDFSKEGGEDVTGSVLPSFLVNSQSQQSLLIKFPSSSSLSGLSSPTSQPRSLERCPTSSLDEGEMDFELLEALSRQASHSWLTRSTSASSLSGRDSAVPLRA